MKTKQNFTLMEFLIVVSIFAILSGMLQNDLKSARGKSAEHQLSQQNHKAGVLV